MTKPDAYLTIVIPYFNRAEFLARTLKSIEQQVDVKQTVNVIFVDNNSTDRSHEIVADWIKDTAPYWTSCLHISCDKPGAAAARNASRPYVTSLWVMFFDSDDEMPQRHICSILDAINQDKSIDLFYWCCVRVGSDGQTILKRPKWFQSQRVNVVYDSVWSTQRCVIKTDFLDKCGWWNPRVMGWNDWELSVRLLLNNPKARFLPNLSPVIVNSHVESITGSSFIQGMGKWEMALDIALSEAKNKRDGKIISVIAAKAAALAAEYSNEGYDKEGTQLKKDFETLTKQKFLVNICFYWQRIFKRGIGLLLTLLGY